MEGAIDETADLEGLFAKLGGPTIFNMRNVSRVNSMGVHRWIPLVTRFSNANVLYIEDVSYALVQNANVVANMFGSARVRSCMAPYFCSRCKDAITLRVTSEELAASRHSTPQKTCDRCRAALEFDELEGYFGFMKPRTGR
jgi:hypothetical protein